VKKLGTDHGFASKKLSHKLKNRGLSPIVPKSLPNAWHGQLHAIVQEWTDMYCAITHIGRHSVRQTD
jgi:hypothetical protein